MSKRSRKNPKTVDVPFIAITNEPSQHKINILHVFHQAVYSKQLAYMDAMDPDTGEIVPLLVGLQPTEDDQLQIYPLAIVLSKMSEIKNYLVPDGYGNYKAKEESGPAQQRREAEAGERPDGDPEASSTV